MAGNGTWTISSGAKPCDICTMGEAGGSGKASVDGKTRMGPWANMCPEHFMDFGVGLGVGMGQRLLTLDQAKAEGLVV